MTVPSEWDYDRRFNEWVLKPEKRWRITIADDGVFRVFDATRGRWDGSVFQAERLKDAQGWVAGQNS